MSETSKKTMLEPNKKRKASNATIELEPGKKDVEKQKAQKKDNKHQKKLKKKKEEEKEQKATTWKGNTWNDEDEAEFTHILATHIDESETGEEGDWEREQQNSNFAFDGDHFNTNECNQM